MPALLVPLLLLVGCGGSDSSPTPTAIVIEATIVATVQARTPTPSASPIASPIANYPIAPPEGCQIAPRDIASLLAAATPVADGSETIGSLSPDNLPSGEPVDDATLAAITATTSAWVACSNAGDDLRGYAYVTDGFLRRSIAEFGMFAPDELEWMQASPVALPVSDQLALIAVREPRLLPDGRVGALIWIDSRTAPLPEDLALRFFVFAQVENQWFIDEIVQIAPG